MSTITAKDLTREVPRSPLEELDGYPWLARLIDKVRALHAGKIGAYTPYPCGGDRRFIGTVGVDADALGDLIKGGALDPEIVAWVKAHQAPDAPAKVAEYRKALRGPSPAELAQYLAEAKADVAKERPDLDLSGADSFNKLICLEEGHPWIA